MWSSSILNHALLVHGCGRILGEICVVNIYATYDRIEKLSLSNMIVKKVDDGVDCCWCILGDFNAIRRESEHKGMNDYIQMKTFFTLTNFFRN